METITIPEDIRVFCKTADSFPDDIMTAHQQLHAIAPFTENRHYFGLSRPENGEIVYKAAAQENYPGEGDSLKCETLLIKKGRYLCIEVADYMNHPEQIGKAFQQLTDQPGLDPQGYCVERYLNMKDMQCLIRLDNPGC